MSDDLKPVGIYRARECLLEAIRNQFVCAALTGYCGNPSPGLSWTVVDVIDLANATMKALGYEVPK